MLDPRAWNEELECVWVKKVAAAAAHSAAQIGGNATIQWGPIPGRHSAKPALDAHWAFQPALPLPSLTPSLHHRIEPLQMYGRGRLQPGKSHISQSPRHGEGLSRGCGHRTKGGRSRPSKDPSEEGFVLLTDWLPVILAQYGFSRRPDRQADMNVLHATLELPTLARGFLLE